VDVRFSAAGTKASELLSTASSLLFREAGEFVFGEGEDSLELVLVRTLTERSQTLAIAESCTGGHLANRITNVPGASAVLLAGVVSYSNAAKVTLLGVPEMLLAEHGAVSEPVARAMVEGVRRVTGADYALSTTGIAGPGGGSEEKPVGTVFIGISGPHGTTVRKQLNRFDRQTFKYSTAQQAFNQLRLALGTSPYTGPR
jgi:nicotinamide-nucleotide amidase